MRLVLSLVAAVALTAPAYAQSSAPLPRYPQRATFIYDNGRVERFVEADGNRLTWATRSNRTYVRDRSFFLPVLKWNLGRFSGERQIKGKVETLWPLKVGSSASFRVVTTTRRSDRKGERRSVQHWRCTTKATEPVTLETGPIDAFRVECDRWSSGTMKLLQRDIWHYAPAVQHYVRRETINFDDGTKQIYSLRYELDGLSANRWRLRELLKVPAAGAPTAQ
jgi:hypothetical protein